MYSITNEDRIKYYLGKFYHKHVYVDLDSFLEKCLDCSAQRIVYCNKKTHNRCISPEWWGSDNNHPFNNDIESLNVSFTDVGLFLCRYRDGKDIQFNNIDLIKSLPIFIRSRNIGDNLILIKYHYFRCWKTLEQVNGLRQIDWKDKKTEPIWRGQPNGVQVGKTPCRGDLVKKFFHKYNIGYSKPPNLDLMKNNRRIINNDPDYEKHILPSIKIQDQLSYKYLINMEGNDTSSGLPWMLASNSLVLMPKPTQENWLMEGKLTPWIHFVPLDDSLDLEEKLEWCKSHEKECLEIISNANQYMKIFCNLKNELLLHRMILDHYENYVHFEKIE